MPTMRGARAGSGGACDRGDGKGCNEAVEPKATKVDESSRNLGKEFHALGISCAINCDKLNDAGKSKLIEFFKFLKDGEQ